MILGAANLFRARIGRAFIASILLLAAIIVGGMGAIISGVVGTLFMTLTPELLRFVVEWVNGYYKNEEATRETIREGWLHTGDVVEEQDGRYRVVDRLKDIIITAGGKNLSPSEIENAVKSSPFIKECVAIGERRKYVAALIQIDFETVGKWAEESRIPYTNFRNLAENPAVRDLIEAEVAKANKSLAQVANIRRFHLLNKELDHDDDEVTATMKVRRANIAAKYADEIEALYA